MLKLVSTSAKPEREGLLHAALGDYAEAIPAWESFLRADGWGALDDDALELLPYVYRNLLRHEYAGPAMEPLREIANEAQGRQKSRSEEMKPWIRHLHQANIPTIVLPGASFDLLVPARDLGRAIELLTRQGWRAVDGWPPNLTPIQRRYRHALELVSPGGQKSLLRSLRLRRQTRSKGTKSWPALARKVRRMSRRPRLRT